MTAAPQLSTPARTDSTPDEFNPWVTTSSRFLDPEWVFERWNRARTTAMLRIDWRQRLENGALLTDPPYAALLRAGRESVYLLMTAPPDGRRRHRPGSALDLAKHVFAFFRWLVANGYVRLAGVHAETTARYRAWVLARRTSTGRPLAANTTAKYFLVLLDLHRFRHQLSDGLREHPFEGMELDELLGSLAPTGEIPHIPMDIAVPFLLRAVRWVREYGPEIAAALEHCDAAYTAAAAQGRDAKGCGLAAMRSLRCSYRLSSPSGQDLLVASTEPGVSRETRGLRPIRANFRRAPVWETVGDGGGRGPAGRVLVSKPAPRSPWPMPSSPSPVCHTTPAAAPPVPAAEPDWAAVLAALPLDAAELERTARQHGALVRRRAVRSAPDLLRLALAYALTGWSLRLTAVWAELGGLAVLSEAALRQRLRRVQPWLTVLIAATLTEVRAATRLPAVRVRLVDASVVRGPGATDPAWRLHLSVTVAPICRIDGLELTTTRTGETLTRHAAAPDEIVIADRGYSQQRGVLALLAQGAAVVVRYAWQLLPLVDATGTPLALGAWLRTVPTVGAAECAVGLGVPAAPGAALRLVASCLPEEAAAAARRRLRRDAQRKGRTPSALSLQAAGYGVVLTRLPATAWDAAAVLDLYRVRWQVELVIKRLKSLWHLAALRARTAALAQAALLGGLLGALLAERLAHPLGSPLATWFAAVERPVSLWRWTALWQQATRDAVAGRLPLATLDTLLPRLQRHLCDSPRQRLQQAAQVRRLLTALPPPSQLPLLPLTLAPKLPRAA